MSFGIYHKIKPYRRVETADRERLKKKEEEKQLAKKLFSSRGIYK